MGLIWLLLCRSGLRSTSRPPLPRPRSSYARCGPSSRWGRSAGALTPRSAATTGTVPTVRPAVESASPTPFRWGRGRRRTRDLAIPGARSARVSPGPSTNAVRSIRSTCGCFRQPASSRRLRLPHDSRLRQSAAWICPRTGREISQLFAYVICPASPQDGEILQRQCLRPRRRGRWHTPSRRVGPAFAVHRSGIRGVRDTEIAGRARPRARGGRSCSLQIILL